MPEDLKDLLQSIWTRGASTKSDISKTHADTIAIAASMGFLTVLLGDTPTRTWRITANGLRYLEESRAGTFEEP